MSDQAQPQAQPQAPAWLGESPDAEMIGHVQNKGWQTPADAVKSHRELEKLFGADRAGRTLTLPSDDTPEAWAPVWEKLGRPGAPEGYELPVPDGSDAEYAKAMAAAMHKAGLSKSAAKAVAEASNAYLATAIEAQAANDSAKLEAENAQLKKDWGAEFEMRRQLAKRAALNLGLDEADITAMESAAGFSKTLKALAKVGDLLREHKVEGMEVGGFGMTPEAARAKRQQLMADKDWRARAMNPNSREWAELQKIDSIISGASAN